MSFPVLSPIDPSVLIAVKQMQQQQERATAAQGFRESQASEQKLQREREALVAEARRGGNVKKIAPGLAPSLSFAEIQAIEEIAKLATSQQQQAQGQPQEAGVAGLLGRSSDLSRDIPDDQRIAEVRDAVSSLQAFRRGGGNVAGVSSQIEIERARANRQLPEQVADELFAARQDKRAADAALRGGPTEASIGSVRDDFTQLAKTFVTVRDAFVRITESGSDPSPAGDIALIFNYMKLLDPESTVREGEFATVENAASVPGKVRNMWNKMLSGRRVEVNRQDILDRSERLFSGALKQHRSLERNFRKLAKRRNMDPDDIVIPFAEDFEVRKGKARRSRVPALNEQEQSALDRALGAPGTTP